jgi:hypothetical protein
MTSSTMALEDVNSLKVVHSTKIPGEYEEIGEIVTGKPLVIEGKEIASDGLLWLKKKSESYRAQGKKLDEQIQTSPEIIRAFNYYFSIFRPDR